MSKKILVITGDFAEDYEVMVPVQVLQIQGYEVDVVCPDKKADGTIQTAVHDFAPEYQFFVETKGHVYHLNKAFDEVKVEEYLGLYLPGGRAPEYLRYNKKVMEMVEYFLKNKKPVCAVCHALLLLAQKPCDAYIKDKNITCFPSVRSEVECAGVKYNSKDEAVTDGNIVTGQSYMSHVPMLQQFLKVLEAAK
jgi:protease I